MLDQCEEATVTANDVPLLLAKIPHGSRMRGTLVHCTGCVQARRRTASHTFVMLCVTTGGHHAAIQLVLAELALSMFHDTVSSCLAVVVVSITYYLECSLRVLASTELAAPL